MPRFFVPDIIGDNFILDGENGKHAAKSLRMKVGEELILCSGNGDDYYAEITEIIENNVHVNVTKKEKNASESCIKVHLLQCLPKLDKMDFIIQKAVELGVYDITPVSSSRCVSQIGGKELKKLDRWNKISLEAAKQSGRGIIPKVLNPLKLKESLNVQKGDKIIFYEGKADGFKEFLDKQTEKDITILVGPEGGFSAQEVELAKSFGFSSLSLGKRILRTETASLCALSIIMYEKDN
ncbi:MAG: 16S rRNA (uracil(1498)-N(3))-methyltransferase [Clostridia bacterium]